jgi:hypothetical protein
MVISPNKWELDTQAYLNICNITATTPRQQLRDFAAGVNDLGLWNSMVCWPLRSTQNAGTGTTAYSLGGLGTFNGALTNGPTWGVDGLGFVAASSHYVSIPDFLAAETVTAFLRYSQPAATAVGVNVFFGQYDIGNNQRSFAFLQRESTGSTYELLRASNGTSANVETASTATGLGVTSERCAVAQWTDGGGRALWFNKSSISLFVVNAQTARHNSTANLTLGALLSSGAPSLHASMTCAGFVIVTGTVTDAQRETLTDLINGL